MNNHKIKILHLLKDHNFGGITKSVYLYSSELQKKGFEIETWGYKGKYFFENKSIKINFTKREIDFNPLSILRNFLNLYSILKYGNIDIVHYHYRRLIPYIYLIKLFFPHIKIVYTNHNNFNDFKNYLLCSDISVALTKAGEKNLQRFNFKNIVIITHAINNKIANFPQKKESTFGILGSLDKTSYLKNVILTFKGMESYKLIIKGNGSNINELKEIVKSEKLTGYITFEDFSADLSPFFKKISVLINPAPEIEGFSLVTLEALSHNKIVVTNSLEIFKELFTYHNLIFTDFSNIGSIRQSLVKSLEIEPEDLSNLLSDKFNLNATIKKYENLYKSLK